MCYVAEVYIRAWATYVSAFENARMLILSNYVLLASMHSLRNNHSYDTTLRVEFTYGRGVIRTAYSIILWNKVEYS